MYNNNKVYKEFVSTLKTKIQAENQKIVFLCIGSNKIIGDCFGPLVGSKLKNLLKEEKNIKVIGDMEFPVNSKNIYKTIKMIDNNYKDSFIVSIDSAISNFNLTGNIFITNDGIAMGEGINKKMLKVGDIGIKACVGTKCEKTIENIKKLEKVPKILIEQLSRNSIFRNKRGLFKYKQLNNITYLLSIILKNMEKIKNKNNILGGYYGNK